MLTPKKAVEEPEALVAFVVAVLKAEGVERLDPHTPFFDIPGIDDFLESLAAYILRRPLARYEALDTALRAIGERENTHYWATLLVMKEWLEHDVPLAPEEDPVLPFDQRVLADIAKLQERLHATGRTPLDFLAPYKIAITLRHNVVLWHDGLRLLLEQDAQAARDVLRELGYQDGDEVWDSLQPLLERYSAEYIAELVERALLTGQIGSERFFATCATPGIFPPGRESGKA